MSDDHKLLITPQTKVGELLETYPELEDVLIEIAPPFKKLRNPVLRRTVARVTSLAQAARVGDVSIVELVQRLREVTEQPEFNPDGADDSAASFVKKPDWVDESKVTQTLDARPMIDKGEQPIGRVLGALDKQGSDDIYELITPFEPAPLIDKARERGFKCWSTATGPNEHRTYFSRR